MKTLAIIPVFNEAAHVTALLSKFPKGVCDVIVIDDASTDATPQEIERSGYPCVRHPTRGGVGQCLQDGFAYALEHGYETVVVMAGNGKDNPQEIDRLLIAIEQGAEYVQGSRFLKGGERKNLPFQRYVGIKLLSGIWSLCLGRRLTDVTNGFRAYRVSFLKRPLVQWKQAWLSTYELEYYLHYYALKLCVPFCEVPVSKNYPTRKNYSKIRPLQDWGRIVLPLFLLLSGRRK